MSNRAMSLRPHLLATFYSMPFDIEILSNSLGESCPANHTHDNDNEEAEYDAWKDAEKKILFKYWMCSEFKSDFYNVKDNCIYFLSDHYMIRQDKNNPETEIKLPLPETVDDFIRDCERAGIELYWKDEVVKKYFK